MGFTFAAELGKDLQHFALKRVVRANDANVKREVSGGGSVSRVPSTKSATRGSCNTSQWTSSKANRGQSRLFRFADDFVCCFDYRHEAEAFGSAVKERLAKFGLELAMDKTQTLRFGRNGGGHNGRFDFLGFEFRWENSRKGFAIVKRRTSRKKLQGAVARFSQWIREHRHQKLRQTMKTVAQKHQGHWNYYGLIGKSESLSDYRTLTLRALYYWLNRRSQKRSYTWQSFNRLLKRYAVPLPRIIHNSQSSRLRSKPEWSRPWVEGVNLLGVHYRVSRA